MKKAYSKPTLEVIAFELSETIAACSEKVHSNHVHDSCDETVLGAWMEGKGMSFTQDKADCSGYEGFEQYCYYTSQNADGITLFNS